MLNKIWPVLIISSLIYGICCGNIEEINISIFQSGENTINLTLKLLGTICLWSGIIKIVEKTSIINHIKKIIKPIIKILFPKINEKDEVYQYISINMIGNILGLGNAATPTGLKAIKLLQEKNMEKNKISDEMAIFIVLNTASIQLIPTTVLAVRNSLGSKNPTFIIIPIWVATICAALTAIIITKIILKINK